MRPSILSGANGEGGDAPASRELEMERQGDGAAGEVAGDVDGRVVTGAGRLDVVDGVGDAGDLAAPRADGGDGAMRLALVLDDCVVGELREVGVGIGLRREVKVAVDEFFDVGHGFLPSGRGGQVVGMVPPSMTYSAPLMALARSGTRNATSSAASAGCAGRPIGMQPPVEPDRGEQVQVQL